MHAIFACAPPNWPLRMQLHRRSELTWPLHWLWWSCYVHVDDSQLRSGISDRDEKFTLGLMVVLRYRFIQALLNKSDTYLFFSHNHHDILVPPTFLRFRNPPPLSNKASADSSAPSILVSYPKKVQYRTHFPQPHEASARFSPHLLTSTLLIFLVACPVLILD